MTASPANVKSQPGSNRKSGRKEDITRTIGIQSKISTEICGTITVPPQGFQHLHATGTTVLSHDTPLINPLFNGRNFGRNAPDLPPSELPRHSNANAHFA